MIYNYQRSVYKKNACLISPFPFTIWSIHSIDEIKRYADRTLHKNCSNHLGTRWHSLFFTIEIEAGEWQTRCFLATHDLHQLRTTFQAAQNAGVEFLWRTALYFAFYKFFYILIIEQRGSAITWRITVSHIRDSRSSVVPHLWRHVRWLAKIEVLMAEVRVSGKFNSLNLDFWAK